MMVPCHLQQTVASFWTNPIKWTGKMFSVMKHCEKKVNMESAGKTPCIFNLYHKVI
jgi:hypothetical protein